MKVRAIKTGFYKGRRYEGDTFEVPDSWKANWVEPAGKPAPVVEEVDREDETLGQVQKRNAPKAQKVVE